MIIHDFPNYHIFRNGAVLSSKGNPRFKDTHTGRNGYVKVVLYNLGKSKTFLVHRLLAIHFIPNPNKYPIIDHIDGNKTNNNLNNLRWCTHEMNNSYDNKKLMSNNKSGIRGISLNTKSRKWIVKKKNVPYKSLNTKEEAITYLSQHTKTDCPV